MSSGAGLHVIILLCLLAEGTAVIQTQQTVVAAVGEDARLSCQLLQPKEVHQVTWQKVLPEGKKDVATYSEHFGSNVNLDFQGKVQVKDAGLQSSSIVIRNVTEQDGGCYLCLFNSFPDGALTGKTCLQLYELHEPILHVRESNSSEESVVSCSATGRPAPTVTLNVSQPHLHLSHYNTVTVNNNNGTVTVNTTAVLSGFPDNGAQVGCAARVLSVHKEVMIMIPEVKQTSADDFSLTVVLTCVCVVAVIITTFIIIIIVIWLLKRKNRHSHRLRRNSMEPPPWFFLTSLSPSRSDSEKIKTPQREKIDVHEIITPIIKNENEQMRLRTSASTKKNRPNSCHLRTSPSNAKRLSYEES